VSLVTEKSSPLFLLKYLAENTDENHQVNSVQLREILRKNGYSSDPRTIRKDASKLVASGFDIIIEEQNGVPTRYYYGTRIWDKTELRILIDAVSSAQFITKTKTRQLVEKLSGMAGNQNKAMLTPSVFVSENVKAHNNQILYTIENVAAAIQQKKKISFKLFNYNMDKKRIYRHDGEVYVLSPYATIWKEDRYYVVGFSDKREKLVTFRIDRMAVPQVLDEAAVPVPEDFRLQDYTDKVTRMYTGEEYKVTLRCKADLIDNIIDKFGKDVEISNITVNSFDATAVVSVSQTFLGWVFQYAGEMTIQSPERVRDMYRDMMKAALHDSIAGLPKLDA